MLTGYEVWSTVVCTDCHPYNCYSSCCCCLCSCYMNPIVNNFSPTERQGLHELTALLIKLMCMNFWPYYSHNEAARQPGAMHAVCAHCVHKLPLPQLFFSDRQVTSRQAARRHAGSLCTLCAQTPSTTTFTEKKNNPCCHSSCLH